MPPDLSVVVPFYDEEAAAFAVVDELCRSMAARGGAWEVILVEDGSRDGTALELERVRAAWPQCRVLRMGRNQGQGGALLAGIRAAQAPIIAMMDGDGQNVPEDLAFLLPLLAGADLVVGMRTARHDSWLRRRISRFANAVRGRLLGDRLSDAGCALKVFRREVADVFFPLRMLNPFMPAIAVGAGFRVAEFPVRHRDRRSGRSKYGLRAMAFRPLADLFTVWRINRSRAAR